LNAVKIVGIEVGGRVRLVRGTIAAEWRREYDTTRDANAMTLELTPK